MSLSPKRWNELKEGWGLAEVPPELREEMGCCLCGDEPSRCKLYTDMGIGGYRTVREYQARVDKMRGSCYCRYHAEQMFGEERT